jgi:hypothetical protein
MRRQVEEPAFASAIENSVKRLRLQCYVSFAGGFLLSVLLHPGLPTFSGRGVASSEGESSDIGVGDGDFLARVFRIEANYRIFQGRACPPIKKIAFNFRSVLASDSHVAAVVECFFKSAPYFFVARKLRDPALEILVGSAGRDFQSVGIDVRHSLRR